MELTTRLNRRFIEDYSLPITIAKEPYFSYFIDLYDDILDTKKKKASLERLAARFVINGVLNDGACLDYLTGIGDKVVLDLKANPAFMEYLKLDLKKYTIEKKYPATPIFKECCLDKRYVSIDLSSANFQAINKVAPDIFQASSFEDFLRRYTDEEYVLKSKGVRQIILGRADGNRKNLFERYLMNPIVEDLEKMGYASKIATVMNDEVVFEGDMDDYNKVVEMVKTHDVDVDVELFDLKAVRKKDGCLAKSDQLFVKEFLAHTDKKKVEFEIKATSKPLFAQMYKLYTNQEVNDMDLAFIVENCVAEFKDRIADMGSIY